MGSSMKQRWLRLCQSLSSEPPNFYAAARKILRNKSVTFKIKDWKNDLSLEDIGYTKMKLNKLIKDYLHLESHDKAIELWDHFTKRGSYASASFTTYNHLVKSGATSPSESIETRGPCLQSVVLTLIPAGRGNRQTVVDVFYRTTEFYKKFPADLLLVRELLKPFDFRESPIEHIRFNFANVTMHPMYCVVPATMMEDPVDFFENMKHEDPDFYRGCVSWTHKYLVSSRGITKFEQAKATQRKALESLKKNNNEHLTDYIDEAFHATHKIR